MINWPQDKNTIFAFAMGHRNSDIKKAVAYLETEYQRILREGYNNLDEFKEYSGAVKTLEDIISLFRDSSDAWDRINEQKGGG